MPPELYSDDNGHRVIVRHKGPPGPGLPSGGTVGQIAAKASANPFDIIWVNPPDGTDAVTGPASSVNGNFALFDGVTGKLLKDSTFSVSHFATKSYADTKQDQEAGKGLSQENFTTTLLNKLNLLNPAGYRGTFGSLAAINSNTFSPLPRPGDYCLIGVDAVDVRLVLWDATNIAWSILAADAVDMTGAEIAAVLFDGDDAWTIDDCRIFTEAYRSKVDAHESLVQSLSTSLIDPAQGTVSYFSLTGVSVTLTGTSDGLTNMVKVDVPTTVSGTAENFDNGGASNGRLRYTGNATRMFQVSAKVSFSGANGDRLVLAVAKNGSVELSSRALEASKSSATASTVTLTAVVQLSLNDYLEVFVGNTTDTSAPTVHVLSIEASII